MENVNLRLWFNKKGYSKYISHLDVTRLMQRAFTRADIPIWYTQGFNPHPYMTFALPLALGCESICESMDFRVIKDKFTSFSDIKDRLNAVLPKEIQITEVSEPVNDPKIITCAEYEIYLSDDEFGASKIKSVLDNMLALNEILVMKKTKRGLSEFNLKPHLNIKETSIKDGEVYIKLKLPAGNILNVNASLVFDKLGEMLGKKLDYTKVTRVAVLDKDNNFFK